MKERDANDKVRVDKWLWAARFFKTRSQASDAVDGGKVYVNGERAKRAKGVSAGDSVRLRQGPYEYELAVRALSEKRGPAPSAALLYEESEASRVKRERIAAESRAMDMAFGRGATKPGKKERRQINRSRGR